MDLLLEKKNFFFLLIPPCISGNLYYPNSYPILFEVRANSACAKLFEVKHLDILTLK